MTDEFPELRALRDEPGSDAQARVIGAVIHRIAQQASARTSLVDATCRVAWPAMVGSLLAASIVVATRQPPSGTEIQWPEVPSTAAAMGFSPVLVRWTDERGQVPQLFELMTQASFVNR